MAAHNTTIQKECIVCRKREHLLRCSGCNAARYCCKQHQLSDWARRHKLTCARLDKKQSSDSKRNPGPDFTFVGENGGTRLIEFYGGMGQVVIIGAKQKAARTGDHQSIGMMYGLLKTKLNPRSKSEFTDRALRNQLNEMYAQNVDFSEYKG